MIISVLYVDDEPDLLEIGKEFLEQSGQFTVDIIPSASAALTLLGTKNYDAIISDYQMPGMNGIEFLKKVRNAGNAIPFILFTGRGREEIVIQALNEGADFYLQKGGEPVSQFTELAYKIRQAVQRRMAEACIKDHERREADIINFLPDATFAIDTNGRVIAWNQAIEEMTGFSSADMLGKGDYEYAIPFYGKRQPILIDLIFESDNVLAKNYAHIVKEKDILIADTRLSRPKGKTLLLMGKASPLYNRQGRIVGAIESIRDITERERAQQAIELAHKKLNLMNNITWHNLLNIFTGLFGTIDMALETGDKTTRDELLTKIKDLAGMIREQMEFSIRYEEVGVREPVWLSVEEIIRRVSLAFESSGARIGTDLAGIEVYADPLFEKVIYNLIDNAISHGGNVTEIRLSGNVADTGYILTCEDDGVGIPPEMKEKIFEKREGHYCGFNLFLVREILTITGITIRETGDPGKGARFEMTVPESRYRIHSGGDISPSFSVFVN
ncbi:MAG TPA: response regulator [Methanoregula sp.]|nr:response regulator [Methanoregula sp.]